MLPDKVRKSYMLINTEKLLKAITQGEPYTDWVGSLGYNTAPYKVVKVKNGFDRREYLPVSTDVGHACGYDQHLNHTTETNHTKLLEILENCNLGDAIVIPDYNGCNCNGYHNYKLVAKGLGDTWRVRYEN